MIPIFKSVEEEAEFWDTHDTEEFADEFEPVEVKFARPLKHKWVLTGFIPKVNVDQDNILRIISGEGKLFLVEEHIR
ncbi:hypothetical protein CW713_05345 [Methanophagales archaeon]|nr:MAG: hypothetical protein CW713_05345 [Methanophagales archaeon]